MEIREKQRKQKEQEIKIIQKEKANQTKLGKWIKLGMAS